MLHILQTALELGFLYALVAMALFLSFRILNIADMTTDGCFVLGAAVSVTLAAGGHPILAIPAAMLAGSCAGFVTAFLQTRLGIPSILAGIVTNTGLYTVNLMAMGWKANQSLLGGSTIFTLLRDSGIGSDWYELLLAASVTVLAGVLLLAVYMGLAYLGATVSGQYTSAVGRAELIMAIVGALLGKGGMIIFGAVVGLACVTTAIALTSSAAAYFSELCRGKVKYKVFVVIICVFSAVVSNLGLDRIVSIAAPVLDVVYPPALVLILISLVSPKPSVFVSRAATLGALLTSVLCTVQLYVGKLTFLEALPLYDLGLSWILPAVIFAAAAALLNPLFRSNRAGSPEPRKEL